MKTEEKAKAYDEALNWMRELYPGLHGATKEDAEHYFPELRESEDERIRKGMIRFLESEQAEGMFTHEARLSWIAYLEKQKEQIPYTDFVIKPHKGDDNNPYDMRVPEAQEYAIKRGFGVPFNDGEVYVDERHLTQTIGNILRWADEHPKEQKEELVYRLNGLMQEYINESKDEVEQEHRFKCYKLFWDALEDTSYFEQKEQKELPLMDGNADLYFDEWNQQKQNPTKRQCFEEGIRYAQRLQKEQKPNSTEDMPYITDEHFYEREPADSFKYKLAEYMTKCCTKKEGPYGYTYGISAEAILKMAEEELLKRGVVQKPAEWNDEDKKDVAHIIRILDDCYAYGTHDLSKTDHENLVNKLKSLRPQPQQNMSIGFMIYLDEHRPDGKMCLSNAECNEIETAFKNQSWDTIIRYIEKYQPHWKPSEEQMNYLCAAVDAAIRKHNESVSGYEPAIVLKSLYEQLQKLM